MRNEKLRGVFERLGHDQVRSVISSGNILFASADSAVPAVEAPIEQALHDDLGITSTTIIRNLGDLQALIGRDPFAGLTHDRRTYLTVTFLKERHQLDGADLGGLAGRASRVVDADRELGTLCAVTDTTSSASTPDFMRDLEKMLGKNITTRT